MPIGKHNSPRGLAITKLKNPEKVKKIARKGGVRRHKYGNRAGCFTKENASKYAAKAGAAIIAKYGKEYMRELSKRGLPRGREVLMRRAAERKMLKELEQQKLQEQQANESSNPVRE